VTDGVVTAGDHSGASGCSFEINDGATIENFKTLKIGAKKTLLAVRGASTALAALSAGIGYELNTGYDDEGMRVEDLKYYNLYSLSSSELSTITGKTGSDLTAEMVTTWFTEDKYFAQKSAIISASSTWEIKRDGTVTDISQKIVGDNFLAGALKGNDVKLTDNDWAILFYDNGDRHYVRVAQATKTSGYNEYNTVGSRGKAVIDLAEGGFLYRGDPGDAVSYGAWKSVPEPTSGMLMLLGLAGLCLRRKQRG